MTGMPEELKEMRRYGDEEIEVVFRPPRKIEDALSGRYYPNVLPCSTIENGILIERDVTLQMRDGTMVYTDIYRPEGSTNLPAIVHSGPMGKRIGYNPKQEMLVHGVPPGAISRMSKFEALDPAYWCHYGYAIINPDVRGAGMSQGDIITWGTQAGRDDYDIIEWVAARDWSNGKVGMAGNSWLAMDQWFAAAEKPPHLACIAPWEGCSDIYREFVCWGGIRETGFLGRLLSMPCGGRLEDILSMAKKYPMMNAYWEDKVAHFEDIEIPAYITGGWCHFHLRGSIEGFKKISSPKKWLRVHRDFEWADAHQPENLEDLRRFFDRYLKDIRNGWELTPRVRLDVMDAGELDYRLKRPEKEFPLARTQYQKLFLDAESERLLLEPVKKQSSVRYESTKEMAKFDFTFDEDTELTGYLKLRLWVEADGADDMDLFITVQKLNEEGIHIPMVLINEPHPGLPGRLRVSLRELDEQKSTPFQPYYTYRNRQLLKRGEIVPVEIEIWPTSLIWHALQQLRVVVSGHYFRAPGWFEPFAWDTINRGNHIIHTGGKYDSHLLVPVIPPKYRSGKYIYR